MIVTEITKELLDDCLQNQQYINLKTSELTTDHPSTWKPVKGCNNRNRDLVKQLYNLYINGDMHPTVYCVVFGLTPGYLRSALKHAGPLMDRKTSLKVYGDITLKLREATMMDLYQVKNAGQSPVFQEKAQQTNLERYGFIHASQSDMMKEKMKQTNLERYGVEASFQSEEVRAKIRFTNLIKYGAPEFFQSEEFKQKRKRALEKKPIRKLTPEELEARVAKWKENQDKHVEKNQLTCWERYEAPTFFGSEVGKDQVKRANLEKYGVENPFQSSEIQQKIRQSNLDLYGVENPSCLPAIRERVKQTNLKKYGVETPSQAPEIKEKIFSKQARLMGIGDPWSYGGLDSAINNMPNHPIILPNGEINRFAEMRKIILGLEPSDHLFNLGYCITRELELAKKLGIKDDTNYSTELKLSKFLNELGCKELKYLADPKKFADCRDLDYVQNAKKLHGVKFNRLYYDMDFYFPKLKLGIEVNGLQNHSVNAKAMGKGDSKSKEYHFEKFKAFRDSGILMLSFTDYEQDHFRNDYESIIKHHLLGEPLNISKDFLEFNQISNIEESLNYGLFDPSRFTGNFEDHQHQRFIDKYEYWDCGVIR